MNNVMETAKYYFQSWEGNFWCWADNGAVAETSDGKTIVYRIDLIRVLDELVMGRVPALDAVMLVLIACRSELEYTRYQVREVFAALLETDSADVPDEVGQLLENIRKLPLKYRTGTGRALLLNALILEHTQAAPLGLSQQMLELFKTGRLSGILMGNVNIERIRECKEFLTKAFLAYPDYASLLRKLETGQSGVPEPLPVEFPDILSELDADGKTAGISRLARLLKAVMHFPPDTEEGVNDPFGGVSDIGNRGDLHRLLLSELAQDDDMLLARLANNETLFYRKEDTPSPPDLKKFVCIDVTIRMWGANRLFAIAAALAYTLHDDAEVWMMTGDEKLPADLYTGAGVMEAMTHLSGGQDCGSAMLVADKALKGGECLFVSSEENFHSPDFQAVWVKMKNPPSMLALIGEGGVINVYRTIRHHRKLLSTATYDVQDLLAHKPGVRQHSTNSTDLPAIFHQPEMPLYFPWINRGADKDKDCRLQDGDMVRVTFDSRLMFSSIGDQSAVEILPYVETGKYYFGFNKRDKLLSVLIAVRNRTYVRYIVDMSTRKLVEYTELKQPVTDADKVTFKKGMFCFEGSHSSAIAAFGSNGSANESDYLVPFIVPKTGLVRINYSVYSNPDILYVTTSGKLGIGKMFMQLLPDNGGFRLTQGKEEKVTAAQKAEKKIYFNNNHKVWLWKYLWDNGSITWMDSRGFMHFRSVDHSIPEITIVTITGKVTAAWVSNGFVFGNSNFHQLKKNETVGTVEEFWEKYWQPLIKSLH